MKFGIKTIYFPFLCLGGFVLVVFVLLTGVQNDVSRDCMNSFPERDKLVLIGGGDVTTELQRTTHFTKEIEDRRRYMNERCGIEENYTFFRDVREHLLYSEPHNMVFCYVPKVACTVWKTVFHLVNDPTVSQEELADQIYHMSKSYIHTVRLPWMANVKPFSHQFAFLHTATRVMFTRDPYSRLFSAYVDKLLLPSFWKPVGITIVRTLRPRPNALSIQCGHDVTFEEFLRHVAQLTSPRHAGSIKYGIDDHWIPVSWICQPCHMMYDFIGKIESFTADRDMVLEDIMGLDGTVKYLHENNPGAQLAINQAINSSWFASINFKRCVSRLDVMERLWRAFQIQGHLPFSLQFPIETFTTQQKSADAKEEFRALVLEAYGKHKMTSKQSANQRRMAMAIAYRSVSLEVKRSILETFKLDFEVFNYDQEPDDLYEYGSGHSVKSIS